MNRDNVLALSRLARIDIGKEEADNLSHEFEGILAYVGEVKSIAGGVSEQAQSSPIENTMREDTHPHESGIYTEKILNEAPKREGAFITVKKIL